MADKTKKLTSILTTMLALAWLVMATACSGSSDDDDNENTGGDDSSASGSGGSGGSESTDSSGGTGGTDTGSATNDDGTVEEGGKCTFPSMADFMQNMGDMGNMGAMAGGMADVEFDIPAMTGICKKPDADCPGGTLEGAGAGMQMGQLDPGADCKSGLVCCIDTGFCDDLNKSIKEGLTSWLGSDSQLGEGTVQESLQSLVDGFGLDITIDTNIFSLNCAAQCEGGFGMGFGCPNNQSCCIDLGIDLSDIGAFLDGGTQ